MKTTMMAKTMLGKRSQFWWRVSTMLYQENRVTYLSSFVEDRRLLEDTQTAGASCE
jgi:hypothetical protein